MGLTYLEPLSSLTGGSMHLYPNLDEANLPQVCHTAPMWCPCAVSVLFMYSMGAGYVLCCSCYCAVHVLCCPCCCCAATQGYRCWIAKDLDFGTGGCTSRLDCICTTHKQCSCVDKSCGTNARQQSGLPEIATCPPLSRAQQQIDHCTLITTLQLHK